MDAALLGQFNLNAALAPVLIGLVFSSLSCGIVLTQAATYYSRFQGDMWQLKAIVYLQVGFVVSDCAFNISQSYAWFITYSGDLLALLAMPWQLRIELPWIGTSTFLVSLFYAWRISMVSERNWWLAGSIVLLSLPGWIVSVYLGVLLKDARFVFEFNRVFPTAYVWLACSATSDILITIYMYYFLLIKPKRKLAKGFTLLHNLRRIVRRTVQANVLSLLVQVILAFLFIFRDRAGNWYTPFAWTSAKIYAFSLLASLNARQSSAHALDGSTDPSSRNTFRSSSKRRSGRAVVNVDVQSHSVSDPPTHEGSWSTEHARALAVRFDGAQGSHASVDGKTSEDAHELRAL